MTRGPSKLKMGLRNLRQRDAETAADAAPDAATEALVRHFAKCIQLANGLLEPLDQEHPQVKGTREFRVDPGLAAKLVGSMPKEIKEAYTLGTIRDKNAVSHLPVVFPGDHREGCYLVTVEGHDGSYGVYTGMCGYIKEDGTSTKTGFGTRHGGHTSKAKQTKGESAFYSAVKKAKDWRMIPILVLCGYSKGELEFAETVVQLSLDTSESRCGLDETMQKEGLLRGADTTRFNGSYSVATWGYHPPKRRPPSAEQLEKLREQVRALPRADFSEVGRLKALGYFSELLRGKKYPVGKGSHNRHLVRVKCAGKTLEFLVPPIWTPLPETVTVQIHLKHQDDTQRPLWRGCPVKVSLSNGLDKKFVQKKKTQRLEACVAWWLGAHQDIKKRM